MCQINQPAQSILQQLCYSLRRNDPPPARRLPGRTNASWWISWRRIGGRGCPSPAHGREEQSGQVGFEGWGGGFPPLLYVSAFEGIPTFLNVFVLVTDLIRKVCPGFFCVFAGFFVPILHLFFVISRLTFLSIFPLFDFSKHLRSPGNASHVCQRGPARWLERAFARTLLLAAPSLPARRGVLILIGFGGT